MRRLICQLWVRPVPAEFLHRQMRIARIEQQRVHEPGDLQRLIDRRVRDDVNHLHQLHVRKKPPQRGQFIRRHGIHQLDRRGSADGVLAGRWRLPCEGK